MVKPTDRVALRVSPLGKFQVARQQGSTTEIVAEFDFGQVETVIHWLYHAVAAWAANHQPGPGPSPWFGADPRLLVRGRAGKQPPGTTEEFLDPLGGVDLFARKGPAVPVEALAVLSRLPRDRRHAEMVASPENEGAPEADAHELVDGFAGFKWGTRVSEIPELAWMDPAGETREGIPFYVTYASIVNESGFAAHYVDPLTEQLIGGAYVISPTADHWEPAWYAITDSIRTGYPQLSVAERVRFPRKEPRRKFVYVDRSKQEVVSVSVNSDTGIPLLHALYRSHRLILRQAQAMEDDRRKLGPVGEGGSDAIPLRLVRSAEGGSSEK